MLRVNWLEKALHGIRQIFYRPPFQRMDFTGGYLPVALPKKSIDPRAFRQNGCFV
jgi:hypothetical protein